MATCTSGANDDKVVPVANIVSGSFPLNSSDANQCIGREILIKFSNANTKTSPKLQVGNLNAFPIVCVGGTATVGSGCWGAGATMKFTFDGTSWLMHGNVASIVNNLITYADGTTAYNKTQVDSNLNSALANFNIFPYNAILANANIDTIINNSSSKTYYQLYAQGESQGTKPSSNVGYGVVQTMRWHTNFAVQMFYEMNDTNRIYTRYYRDGTWKEWKRIDNNGTLLNYTEYEVGSVFLGNADTYKLIYTAPNNNMDIVAVKVIAWTSNSGVFSIFPYTNNRVYVVANPNTTIYNLKIGVYYRNI